VVAGYRSCLQSGVGRVQFLAARHACQAESRAIPNGRRPGNARRGVYRGRLAEHGQATSVDARARVPNDPGSSPVLRRARPFSTRHRHGRIPQRLRVRCQARAGRRVRPDHAVELPAAHGDMESGSRARRREYRGAEAIGNNAGDDGDAGGGRGRVPAAGGAQRRCRGPQHGRGSCRAPVPGPDLDHRQHPRRPRRRGRGRRSQTHSPGTRREGTRRSRWATASSTGSPPRSGRRAPRARTGLPGPWTSARSGSTAT